MKSVLHASIFKLVNDTTNSISRTMGIISSRAVLCKPPEPRKSEIYYIRNIAAVAPIDRLVCNKLCEEVQCSIFEPRTKTCNCVPLIQVSSQSIQQEDVRPILSMEANRIS